jgi:hypothetical protein
LLTLGIGVVGLLTPTASAPASASPPTTIQSPTPNWGLDRIDQRSLPLDGMYQYQYTAPTVDVYVVSTGIDTANSDFGGRAIWGANFVDTNNQDCNGQGTALAGIVGGTTYGVAKNVTLIAVKVLNCAGVGTDAQVIAGLNWAATNQRSRGRESVAVLGESVRDDPAIVAAVNAASRSGLSVVVPAGDNAGNACNYSPANATDAISVAATNISDHAAGFSNGSPTCVTLFAPGVSIATDWPNGTTRAVTGTAVAAAFVGGAAAQLDNEHPGINPSQVKADLVANATQGVVIGAGGDCNPNAQGDQNPQGSRCVPASPNLLLYNGPGV